MIADPISLEAILQVLRAVGVITGIVAAGWKVVPWTRDRLRARRDADAAHAKRRAEVAAGVESLLNDMKFVRAELQENGGGSVKDAVLAFRSELALERAARRAAWGQAAYEVQIHADGQLSVLHVTPQWTALTGLSRDEAAMEGWTRSVHPDDRERVKHSALEALEAGTVFVASYRLQNVRTYQECFVEHIGTPVLDRRNRLVGFVGVVTPTESWRHKE